MPERGLRLWIGSMGWRVVGGRGEGRAQGAGEGVRGAKASKRSALMILDRTYLIAMGKSIKALKMQLRKF